MIQVNPINLIPTKLVLRQRICTCKLYQRVPKVYTLPCKGYLLYKLQ
jgi:hypothetical protein